MSHRYIGINFLRHANNKNRVEQRPVWGIQLDPEVVDGKMTANKGTRTMHDEIITEGETVTHYDLKANVVITETHGRVKVDGGEWMD